MNFKGMSFGVSVGGSVFSVGPPDAPQNPGDTTEVVVGVTDPATGALIPCVNPMCPTRGGLPTRAEYSDAAGNPPNRIANGAVFDFDTSLRFDSLNTEGNTFKVGGGPAATGAVRAILELTNTLGTAVSASVGLSWEFESKAVSHYIYKSSTDLLARFNDISTDDRWIAFGTTEDDEDDDVFSSVDDDDWQAPTSIFYMRDTCGGEPPVLAKKDDTALIDFADPRFDTFVCDADGQHKVGLAWDLEFAPGETKSIAFILELFRPVLTDEPFCNEDRDFDNLDCSPLDDMDYRLAQIESTKCGADPAWFSDLTALQLRRMHNFQPAAYARGDVHLVGYRGQEYTVGGIEGKWHALYSDGPVQVNAKLHFPRTNVDWVGSIMNQVSVVAPGGWRVRFDVESMEAGATVAGEILPEVVALGERSYKFGECGSIRWTDESTVEIRTAGYLITLRRREWAGDSGTHEKFIDVTIDAPEVSNEVSGFLGDSWVVVADQPWGPLRSSNDHDYVVGGPYETAFAFSNVDASATEGYWVTARTGKTDGTCADIDALYSASGRAAARSHDKEVMDAHA
jgi:hypothetical protein